MRAKFVCLAGVVVALGFVFTGVASADMTLGLVTQPSGSSPGGCSSGAPAPPHPTLVQSAQDPTTPYFAPASGAVTQWQTNVTGDTPGAALTFAVMRPASGGDYTVVGADNETIPNPLPAGDVATFKLSAPIAVEAGDTLALYSSSAGVVCFFSGGSTPSGDNVISADDPAPPPSPGQTLTSSPPCFPGGGCTLDVAATLAPAIQDAGVSTTAGPSNATAGYPALLSSTVTNAGPGSSPITVTDSVPAGLTINGTAAAPGACTTSGQKVTCTITGLGVGQSGIVDIVVTPTASGNYANGVSTAVNSPFTDPNPANDSASATLTVQPKPVATGSTPPPPPLKCAVPKLKGLSLPFVKHLLHLLNCTAGRVHHTHSRSVRKGHVIRTSPGAGTYAAGHKVALVVSSGPPKKKRHKH